VTALLVALGAAVGAPLRYAVAHALDEGRPAGTLLVNVLGSGLAGCFAALALSEGAWALLVTGFCGGSTTYSSCAVRAVDLGRPGLVYAAATIVLSVAAAGAGFVLTR
jgi:fluoride exporter